jgi:hypothetical protein
MNEPSASRIMQQEAWLPFWYYCRCCCIVLQTSWDEVSKEFKQIQWDILKFTFLVDFTVFGLFLVNLSQFYILWRHQMVWLASFTLFSCSFFGAHCVDSEWVSTSTKPLRGATSRQLSQWVQNETLHMSTESLRSLLTDDGSEIISSIRPYIKNFDHPALSKTWSLTLGWHIEESRAKVKPVNAERDSHVNWVNTECTNVEYFRKVKNNIKIAEKSDFLALMNQKQSCMYR